MERQFGVLFGRGCVSAFADWVASHTRSWCVSVWHCLLFGILSPPLEVQPCQFLLRRVPLSSCLHLLPAACYLSLISLLTYTFCLTVSLILPSLNPHLCTFSFTHSHIAAHLPSTFSLSLSVLTPWGKWSYVNCFCLDVYPDCYPSILMNSFPPFYS